MRLVSPVLRALLCALAFSHSAFASCLQVSDTADSSDNNTNQAQAVAAEPQVPVIRDEPTRIDPSLGLPPSLLEPVTVDFGNSTLKDFIDWLEDDRGMTVLFDSQAIDIEGLDLDSNYSDRIKDQPAYLLLDRLRNRRLAWSINDGLITITSLPAAEETISTKPYMIGDLRDQGFRLSSLVEVIERTVEPDSWQELGGRGRIVAIGDVLMILQTEEIHRLIASLLEGLRSPARRILIADPAANQPLFDALEQPIACDFHSLPLPKVVERLREASMIDLRLDLEMIPESPDNIVITLTMQNRSLRTVLDSILLSTELNWVVDDGVLWITDKGRAEELLNVSVFDVSDLCRDEAETEALLEAVEEQVQPDSWEELGGVGRINYPRAGLIVVYQTKEIHDEILALLEAYRFAFRNSKRRVEEDFDLEVTSTVFYRVYTPIAEELVQSLPQLVAPGTWQAEGVADGGSIRLMPSLPKLKSTPDPSAVALNLEDEPPSLPYSTLIVEHKRSVQREVRRLLMRLTGGDPMSGLSFGEQASRIHDGMQGMGGMGGGFGGGFLSVDEPAASRLGESRDNR